MKSLSAETLDAVFNWDRFELSESKFIHSNLSMCMDPVFPGTRPTVFAMELF